jgi:hypothetical protein
MMNVVCGLILMHNNEHPFHTKQNSKQGGISRRNEQNQLHVSTLHNSKKISWLHGYMFYIHRLHHLEL